MAVYGASDLPVLLADMGETIAYPAGGTSAKGLVNRGSDTLALGGQVNVSADTVDIIIIYQSLRSGGLKPGDAITVSGEAFKVKNPGRMDDGAFEHLTLEKIATPSAGYP